MEKVKVMIVEDESIVAKDIESMLKRVGYDVPAVVASGEKAIEKVTETSPDLVLMDIMLKGDMDGVEAAEQIRSQFHIPVIYVTAFADDSTLQRAKITEPYGYLLKPFQDRELHTTIEMALYRHKMERKLKESEQWLSTTLRSIGDAVIATDTESCVTFMNLVAQALTGWSQDEAAGKPLDRVFKIVNEETDEPCEDPVERVIRENSVVGLANHTLLIARDGTRFPIDDSAAPIRDDSGNLIGVVLVFRDITERRRSEEESLRAQRLESIGILAGGIAHDFNNILTAIMGNISLARVYNDPGKISERLLELEKASMQAKELIQQLLTFSRGGTPLKETVSLVEILKGTTAFALRGSNVKCGFLISGDLWPVEADPGQISQVISNLIINADQAMPDGGVIKVRAENLVIERDHGLPLENGRYVKISIEDRGTGIPREHLHKMFDPYFTTKQKGSGLGLATSYSIIKRHDGHITAESQVGVGTTIHIYLPASPEGTPLNKKEEEEEEEPVMGRGRVLVMDDEKFIRELASEMLGNIGYETTAATDGLEAIRLYKEAEGSKESYDAVIMDLTVPGGMGGEKAVQDLIKIDPGVKAIASSGYSNSPVIAEYRKYGFCSVITKPYRIKELSEVLHRVMSGE
jgi:two-component system cell cycle sensor histidine kinase/response regulator CckA